MTKSAFVPPPSITSRPSPLHSVSALKKEQEQVIPNTPYASTSSRRNFIALIAAVATNISNPSPYNQLKNPTYIANAAETIGKDPNCNDASCLGVWDGLLADCPHDKSLGKVGCVSSQDDTPGIFAEPWDYSDSVALGGSNDDAYERQMDLLILALQTTSKERGDAVRVDYQSGRYLRAIFTDGTSGEQSVGEFYFTPSDTTVQFRIGSMKSGNNSPLLGRSLSNMERSEKIRKSLRYLKVPVLRNRKRTFVFVESDGLDAFGPGYKEALGPPEEMSPGDVNAGRTRRGSDEVAPRLRIDWVESFPIKDDR
jgi:hypothetical protein